MTCLQKSHASSPSSLAIFLADTYTLLGMVQLCNYLSKIYVHNRKDFISKPFKNYLSSPHNILFTDGKHLFMLFHGLTVLLNRIPANPTTNPIFDISVFLNTVVFHADSSFIIKKVVYIVPLPNLQTCLAFIPSFHHIAFILK